jgi:hypothetical protein
MEPMRRRISERSLRRWLATGRPRWVGRRIDTDPLVMARVDSMTALEVDEVEALAALVTPHPDFAQRTAAGVRHRIDGLETLGVIADLVGLGWQTSRALIHDTEPEVTFDDAQRDSDGPPKRH